MYRMYRNAWAVASGKLVFQPLLVKSLPKQNWGLVPEALAKLLSFL